MDCNLITIFTPTYNRAYILPQLYQSLKKQTDRNFEWVIVDDGSTDETSTLVSQWIKEAQLDIVYYRQNNQGKHIAINSGLELAKGELFFIVDSDDSLTTDAVEVIRDFWHQKGSNLYSGILSYRKFPNGKLVGTRLPENITHCKLRECCKYGSSGDKVVIYRTDVIGKFRYPKFGNEKFFGESYVFNQIDDDYDMLVMNQPIYLFDYQSDGLSQNFRNLYRNNPRGMRTSMIQSLRYQDSLKSRLKDLAHIGCLSIRLHDIKAYFLSSNVLYTLCAAPLALGLYYKIFVCKKNDVKPFLESEDK
jgi:glycosyltransferase involved in cell wall biosynthesis